MNNEDAISQIILEVELDEIYRELLYLVLSQEIQRIETSLLSDLGSPHLFAQVAETKSLLSKFECSNYSEKVVMSKYQIDFCLKMLAKSYNENRKSLIRELVDGNGTPKVAVYTVLGQGLEQLLDEKNVWSKYLG